ncbi:triose-phosphate isomerase [Enterobacteriaceae endosymbiont of Neohaemonia nigricornis]|uniref:triose-phosphate isomerase n=1 Tax=Enterobacteriaceae endosymbiont of Neohaemonia nigricornis TaxID=2675792 RepID=UPI0014491DCF|nr:triose-phosphate isomerase [Enterobacteriaceae endosymbiont of Neohaemonia nigricornis]QJC30385.1 triose-phosphate isomerase [Enterobacteriaceae endosymbiont of Neohaemonia nigricornis]
MRKIIIIGNWKLNGNYLFLKNYLKQIQKVLNNQTLYSCQISIAFPYVYLNTAAKYLSNTPITITAQNVDIHLEGSYTGEISVNMLKDIGVKYIIIGHSERRQFHLEDNILIAHKFYLVKSHGLIPILCIGDNKKEKDLNQTIDVCIKQINFVIKQYGIDILYKSIIAYEPIWAIGSGVPADANFVQYIHTSIRQYIMSINNKVAKSIILQYGGSVNSSNIINFNNKNNIDGFLIGQASLNVKDFISIIQKIEQNIS